MKALDLINELARFVPYVNTIAEAIDLVKGIINEFGNDAEVTHALIEAERAKLLPAPEEE